MDVIMCGYDATISTSALKSARLKMLPYQLMATTSPYPLPSFTPLTVQTLPLRKFPSKLFKSSIKNHDQITLNETKQIHAQMLKTHFQNHPSFQLHSTSVARYNFLIAWYNKHNHPIYALKIYAQMRAMYTEVDSFIISSVLKSCSETGFSLLGREIHGFSLKKGLQSDVFVGNTLIQMYSECDATENARLVFSKMEVKDGISWSTMIRSYGKNRMFDEAFEIVREMQYSSVKPSEGVMISIVNLIADTGIVKFRKPVHAYAVRNSNRDQLSANVTTSLIDMYGKSGSVGLARRLFDTLAEKSVVSYTAMVSSYVRCNALEQGVRLFAQMIAEGISPNEVTLLSLITECGKVEALDWGKQLHAYVLRNGFDMTLELGTSLIDMYGKCKESRSAEAVFEYMEKKDVMTWTALISAYAQEKCIEKAIDVLMMMREAGDRVNQVTMVSMMSLCAEAGALNLGRWIHAYVDRQGMEIDVILATALINMYAKCGDIVSAYSLFDKAASRDIRMWNTMLMGFGLHGFGEEAMDLFNDMQSSEMKPNDITFIGLLTACSHAGMVEEGKGVFQNMPDMYNVVPKLEHYGCMVDLLGRAGLVQEAYDMIQRMPMRPNAIVWGALLAACKVHQNTDLGEIAGRELLRLNPESCGHNVLVSNIYAAADRWTDVADIRTVMKNKGMIKEPGFSCIEVNGSIHEFTTRYQAHPHSGNINAMLEEMTNKLKDVGYKPDTSVVLLNLAEKEKEESLRFHSEKIAMAFGLISTAPGTALRIVKNLRVCEDCHTATKLLSKIYARVFIVRDRSRFHHFRNGSCSCGDYW